MSEDFKSIKSRGTRIASLIRKEMSTLFKDKISMIILFIIPVILIVTVGSGEIATQGYLDVNVYVIDYDDSFESHNLIEALSTNLTITSNWDVEDEYTREEFLSEAKDILTTTKIAAYIIIPQGFGENLTEYGKTELEVHIDYIDFISAIASYAFIELGLVQFQLSSFSVEAEVFYFPDMQPVLDLENLLQMGAPMISTILLFATINLVASQSIVGDIPLKRLLTTPVYRSEVVIAKNVAYSIVSVFQIIITLGLFKLYNVPFYGLFIDIFIVLWLCSIAGITMGVFFSAISKTRLQAAQLFLFSFIVMITVTMLVRVPFVLSFLPLEQAQVAFSNIAYRGMSLMDMYGRILLLLMISAIFVVSTMLYLKRKKEFV